MIDIENLSDEELEAMQTRYGKLRADCIEEENGSYSPGKVLLNRLRQVID
jgi:hypothetical protein